ncbi:MAG: hypothetical protein IJX37_10420 [Oscillospiraceae bacterium]|nr:hypothetical protein [Oscillospiraceae bacterium]
MLKNVNRIICAVLVIVLSTCSLAACGDLEESTVVPSSTAGEENTVVESGVADEETMSVLDYFVVMQDNETMPFTLTEKAKVMLEEKEAWFLVNQNEGLDDCTDFALEYKVLNKNIDKHGDKLVYLEEAYVLSIDETQIDEQTTFSELHLLDADGNSYYVISLVAYDDIYEDDVVSVYALPIGETAFDNVSGGTTLAIMCAGCYVEKLEY